MTKQLKIDFVSDVACPWCAVGMSSLQQALDTLGDEVAVELRFHPFELNPDMPPEGEDVNDHLRKKYRLSQAQLDQNQEALRERGEQVGFTFNLDKRRRIYNTFNAHRLLHWAGLQGCQAELEQALFQAYFTEGQDVSDEDVLVRLAVKVGLDAAQAMRILESETYATEVREREAFYQQQGIHSVPSIIINDQYLIQGGQPPDMFERALREIAAERA